MRKNHIEHIDRWIKYMRENPKKWRKIHTDFINGQLNNSSKRIKELAKTRDGCSKIVEIYKIKNIEGYPNLLKKLF